DVLKKLLHRQWTNAAEMAAAIDPLLARVSELVPEAIEEGVAETAVTTTKKGAQESSAKTTVPRAPASQALPQAKSVRISLERLDRMMNAVGELVINRTRMVGRLAELAKLVEVLNFLEGRLSGKISDFQEKHEFNRLSGSLVPGSHAPQMDTTRPKFPALPAMTSNDL